MRFWSDFGLDGEAGEERVTLSNIIEGLLERLAPMGFELCAGFDVRTYNRAVPEEFALPTLERRNPVGVIIGNHRGLWAPFTHAYRERAVLQQSADPLDRYTEDSIHESLRVLSLNHEVRFGHKTEPSPVAMQQLAQIACLAELTPAHLSVHPIYGPWIALRAAVVLDLDEQVEIAELQGVCDAETNRACAAAFEEALRVTDGRGHEAIRDTWEAWLAVRDACRVGRSYRYSESQIGYHYTHARHFLTTL